VSAKCFKIHANIKKLASSVVDKENPKRNIKVIGDKNLENKAIGIFQIRNPYLTDVNKIAGKKSVRKRWGKNKLTLQDMKNWKKAEWAFCVYISHYGELYTKKTKKLPTVEVYARIHNGGPIGWKNNKTIKYGKDVVELYKKRIKTRS
jgi:hypothetical protein